MLREKKEREKEKMLLEFLLDEAKSSSKDAIQFTIRAPPLELLLLEWPLMMIRSWLVGWVTIMVMVIMVMIDR